MFVNMRCEEREREGKSVEYTHTHTRLFYGLSKHAHTQTNNSIINAD